MKDFQSTRTQNITFSYSAIQCFYWMGFASVSAFSSVYLLSLGVSNTVIGTTLALGSFLSALSLPYISLMADQKPNITTKSILVTCSIAATVTALLLFPASKGVPVIVPAMYVVLMLLLQFAQPFSNSIGMVGLNAGYKLNFGLGRAVGSLGYALVAFVLGKASERYGSGTVPIFIALSFFLTFIASVTYPVDEKSRKKEVLKLAKESEQGKKPGLMTFFKKYGTFAIALVGLTLIYYSHIALNSFGLQIITTKGGSNAEMGIATAISASVELIPMILFPILIKKFKLSSMLKVSAVFFTLKILFTLLAPNVGLYYAAQLFQTFGWGILAVSIVYYVNELVDESDSAQGQSYASMTLTLANVIGNLFGGRIIDALGVNAHLTIGFIVALIGTIIFFTGLILTDKATAKRI